MAELYPDGTVAPRSPSVLVMVLALSSAVLLGAGLMFAGWALFSDDDVATPAAVLEQVAPVDEGPAADARSAFEHAADRRAAEESRSDAAQGTGANSVSVQPQTATKPDPVEAQRCVYEQCDPHPKVINP